MPATLLSIARSLVESAISKAASAAAHEMSLLMGVRTQIWFIEDELKTIQAFLAVAEAIKKKDMLLKVWVEQVTDVSYDIEDCLDEFMVCVGTQSLPHQLLKLKDRHRIATQICNLKSRVEEVSTRNTRYDLIKKDLSSSTAERDSFMEDIRNQSSSNINEAELVGFSKPKEDLIKLIDAEWMNGPPRVVCVVGMGGLGKTTITRKIYERKDGIAKNFSCCAWITVSQSFVRKELLKQMIRQLLDDDGLTNCLKELDGKVEQVDDLARYLRENLEEKRYFVVLDDLWDKVDWIWIRTIAFPANNSKGSRIVVTTRDVGLAKECTSDSLIYHLKPLEQDDAIKLLLRKTRNKQEEMANNENMRTIVTKIVKKCGCLPLAILTIGGLLATKMVTKWGSIYNQLPSELETNPSLEAMRRMVTLSYNHLPSHLKPCFLYLSIFPEDYEIQRRRLVDRWIAEGFVKPRTGMTIEDVGESYFNELLNRSMIQASRVNIEGITKSCRVHDIMRDITISISRAENFIYLIEDKVTSVAEKFRHVAYHGRKCPTRSMGWSHLRSLTVFGERPMEPTPSLCSPDLRMLRALDLQDAQFPITQKDIKNVELLRHLKYMNIRCPLGYSYIYTLPRSMGKLQGLQTLDIRNSYITEIPTEISKLRSLRSLRCSKKDYCYHFERWNPKEFLIKTLHLPVVSTPVDSLHDPTEAIAELHMAYSSHWSESEGVTIPKGIGNLKELQILEVVDITRTSSKAVKELGELTQLRKLRVASKGATRQKCKILCAAFEELSSLCSLRVDANERGSLDGTVEWLHSVSSPPLLLRSLKLDGCLREIPNWVGNLMHVVKIYLRASQLEEGEKTMKILGSLPNLMLLSLGSDSYVGMKLVFIAGAFPNLRNLDIDGSPQLRELSFKEDTLRKMERILIDSCKLRPGIIGIGHLQSLKEISLGHSIKVANLDVMQDEVDMHPNRPVLQLLFEDRWRYELDEWEVSNGEAESTGYLPETTDGSSQVAMPTTNKSEDLDMENVKGSMEDDFSSCVSDCHADDEDAC